MEEEAGFDSVQWDREHTPTSPGDPSFEESSLPHRSVSDRRTSTASSSEPQAGDNADAIDLAGIGPAGTLECTVDSPMKENDGTKDAYVSYKITTHVCTSLVWCWAVELTVCSQISRPS